MPGTSSRQQGHAVSGSPVVFTDPHGYIVAGVAFSPNGQTLAVAATDPAYSQGNTFLWNIANHNVTTLTNPVGLVPTAVAIDSRGNTMAVGDANFATYLWNPATAVYLRTLNSPDSLGWMRSPSALTGGNSPSAT